ncbi:S-methylmethionine--homocysteine S-methyltransferase BHMT2 [Trachypithecus francoisi]|uniref:S-methylmethionine--homocysteine S-methyltransferase BHMT2 n=1 Tax=Trachypithecus francoisi TaxID=54180 RepID=UPI00141BBFEB|nr:S-methylmethionine--homocysteine S-methyltransferase BHMT2 [Trachypithecus francoisi]
MAPAGRPGAKKGILERLESGEVVIGDGSFLISLEKRGYVKAGLWTPEAVIEHPDAVCQLHMEFLRAGSNVMQTFTFSASEDNMESKWEDVNAAACDLAREVAGKGDALVAGGICQTSIYKYHKEEARIKKLFRQQLEVFAWKNVDFLIAEVRLVLEEKDSAYFASITAESSHSMRVLDSLMPSFLPCGWSKVYLNAWQSRSTFPHWYARFSWSQRTDPGEKTISYCYRNENIYLERYSLISLIDTHSLASFIVYMFIFYLVIFITVLLYLPLPFKICFMFGPRGQVTFLLVFEHVEEAVWAVEVLKESDRPVAVTMCIGPEGDMHDTTPGECAVRLVKAGASIVGVNCRFGPETSLKTMELMKEGLERAGLKAHLMVQPLGFHTPDCGKEGFVDLPEYPFGLESRVATRWDIQKYAREAYNLGVRYIGGCCGFEPYHSRAIAEELAPERGFLPPASEKHGSWGSGLDMHTKPWVRARARRDYWENLLPASGRPFCPSLSKPDV